MAAPAYRDSASATNAASATSINQAVPAGTQVGDLLIWAVDANTTSPGTITWGGSFNSLGAAVVDGCFLAVAYKVAVSGDLSATYSASWTGSARNSSMMLAYSGADTTNPINDDASGVHAGAAGTTHTTPSVTTTVADCRVVALIADQNAIGAVTHTEPSGYTERIDTSVGGSGNRLGQGAADTTAASAGSHGGVTYTKSRSSDLAAMWTVAIAPPGVVDLTAADAFHGHATESPTLTQTHVVAPVDSVHGLTADAATLTQAHVIAPADSAHGHAAESPTLTQTHELTPADSAHPHTSDSPALTQTHVLEPDDSTHSHAADSPTLTQVHVLTPVDCTVTHTASSPTVTLPAEPSDPSPERTYTIRAENRAHPVAAENRAYAIATDTRTLTIATDARTHSIRPEDRRHTIQE